MVGNVERSGSIERLGSAEIFGQGMRGELIDSSAGESEGAVLAVACGMCRRFECPSLHAGSVPDAGDLLHQEVTRQRRDRIFDQTERNAVDVHDLAWGGNVDER